MYFKNVIELLESNPFLNLLFLSLSVISLVLSFILYYKNKKDKRPFYTIRRFVLLKNYLTEIKSLEIFYDKEKISNLTLCRLKFWNNGRDTINQSDIAKHDPIRLEMSNEYKFLDPIIESATNPANNFTAKLSNNNSAIAIDFEYINSGDGMTLQFFHNAPEDLKLELKGSIKGVSKIVEVVDFLAGNPSLYTMLDSVLTLNFIRWLRTRPVFPDRLFALISLILFAPLFIIVLFHRFFKLFYRVLPKDSNQNK